MALQSVDVKRIEGMHLVRGHSSEGARDRCQHQRPQKMLLQCLQWMRTDLLRPLVALGQLERPVLKVCPQWRNLLLESPDWCATIRKSARVASRRNVTRPIVVVLHFSSLLWFSGREAPGLFGFQFFPNLSFNRRIGGLTQTAQDQFSYALGSPHLDAALQRP